MSSFLLLYWSTANKVEYITKKTVDEFEPNFIGGKGRPSLCFVTIGGSNGQKNSVNPEIVYILYF